MGTSRGGRATTARASARCAARLRSHSAPAASRRRDRDAGTALTSHECDTLAQRAPHLPHRVGRLFGDGPAPVVEHLHRAASACELRRVLRQPMPSRASGEGCDDLDRQERRTVGVEHREDEALSRPAEEARIRPRLVELTGRERDVGSGQRRRVESRWLRRVRPSAAEDRAGTPTSRDHGRGDRGDRGPRHGRPAAVPACSVSGTTARALARRCPPPRTASQPRRASWVGHAREGRRGGARRCSLPGDGPRHRESDARCRAFDTSRWSSRSSSYPDRSLRSIS